MWTHFLLVFTPLPLFSQPPLSVTVFHIKLDSASDGQVPMLMDPYERLHWCQVRLTPYRELMRAAGCKAGEGWGRGVQQNARL